MSADRGGQRWGENYGTLILAILLYMQGNKAKWGDTKFSRYDQHWNALWYRSEACEELYKMVFTSGGDVDLEDKLLCMVNFPQEITAWGELSGVRTWRTIDPDVCAFYSCWGNQSRQLTEQLLELYRRFHTWCHYPFRVIAWGTWHCLSEGSMSKALSASLHHWNEPQWRDSGFQYCSSLLRFYRALGVYFMECS